MSVLAVVPARGGSKRLPRKNVLDFGGKPLIAWTIEAALSSGVVDRLIVTTDDEEIAKVSRNLGAEVPFLRSESLASDSAATLDVVRDLLERLATSGEVEDLILLLQPTSPLRTSADIREAVALAERSGVQAVVSVERKAGLSSRLHYLDHSGHLHPNQSEPPSDDSEICEVNGAIYIARSSEIRSGGGWYPEGTHAYVMPPERSVDIDTHWDLRIAELGLK